MIAAWTPVADTNSAVVTAKFIRSPVVWFVTPRDHRTRQVAVLSTLNVSTTRGEATIWPGTFDVNNQRLRATGGDVTFVT